MTQLLQNAAAGTVLILAAALLRLALRKQLPPEVWLALWTVCLLRLLTPAAPESPLSLYGLPRLLAPEPPVVQTVPVPAQPDWSAPPGEAFGSAPPVPPASAAPPASPAWNWGAVLAAVWLLGAAALAAWYSLDWLRTRRLVRSAPLLPPSDPRYAALPRGVRLREGHIKGAPFTFGAVRPTVVVPPGLSGAALVCVLAHEGVHVRRRDNLWHYATALACALFWWDPAVWLMVRLLRRDLELSCDRWVVKKLDPERRREYAMTLLSLSTQAGAPGFCRSFGQKLVEERIIAIMNYKKMSACLIGLSVALVCLVTVAFATEPVSDSRVQPLSDIVPIETVLYFAQTHGYNEILQAAQLLPPPEKEVLERSCPMQQTEDECLHLRYSYIPQDTYSKLNETEHVKIRTVTMFCHDCKGLFSVEEMTEIVPEDHSFGSGSYVGANHSAANPAKHYYTYSHTCRVCLASYEYTVPAACTKDGCVSPASVGDVDY